MYAVSQYVCVDVNQSCIFSARILSKSIFVVCYWLEQRISVVSKSDTSRNRKCAFKESEASTKVKKQLGNLVKLRMHFLHRFEVS